MGLALLDVADVIRSQPEVVAHMRKTGEFPDEARDAVEPFLDRYGMRCAGEIDITRPRWSERPSTLVPMILSNVDNFAPGAAGRRREQGRQQAKDMAVHLLAKLRGLPDGDSKAQEAQR